MNKYHQSTDSIISPSAAPSHTPRFFIWAECWSASSCISGFSTSAPAWVLSLRTVIFSLSETTITSSFRVESSLATTICTLYFLRAIEAFPNRISESVSSWKSKEQIRCKLLRDNKACPILWALLSSMLTLYLNPETEEYEKRNWDQP